MNLPITCATSPAFQQCGAMEMYCLSPVLPTSDEQLQLLNRKQVRMISRQKTYASQINFAVSSFLQCFVL